MPTILLVEDEEHLRVTLTYTLDKAGYAVIAVATGPQAVAAFHSAMPDVIVLDIMLPGFDGFEVCRQIRRVSAVPILMLTARTEETDTVVGLELGADDYITKPFRMRELLARIGVALRRASALHHKEEPALRLVSGDLVLDARTHTLQRQGRLLLLKPRAFALLQFFMQHPQQVFTRDQLLHELWEEPYIGDPRTVDVHIRWIREQIEDDPSNPRRLRTVRTIGYQFVG